MFIGDRGWNDKSHQVTLDAVTASRQYFSHRFDDLSEQLASLRVSPAPTSSTTSNKIFQAPSASNTFTGRESLLQHVEQAFDLTSTLQPTQLVQPREMLSPGSPLSRAETLVETESLASVYLGSTFGLGRKQKRFVLIGQGGSGKTEFCCKFAERTQQRYLLAFHRVTFN